MTDLNRRHLLTGAAALGAAAVSGFGPTAANASVPPTGTQAPGFYRYKVGSYECTSINDGARTFPMPDKFVANIPKDEALAAGEAAYMPKGMVTIPFNPQLINTGSKLVLIDTGNGIANLEASKGAVGRTLQNLQAAGVDPKNVDVVLLSHMHGDHINGIRLADGALAFPNAEIMVPGKEWEFWASEENAAKAESNQALKNNFANVKKIFAGLESKVTKYEWGKEVAPGITSIATPGHTPGHTSFAVASGDAKVLIQSDVTNIPEFFLRNPDWHVIFDMDAAMAQATRHKFYDMAAAEKATVVGFHFTFPAVGHVVKDGAKYRLVPSAWNPTI
ncbi:MULTISPECIES: MBL fold metallo-hydrolase [unclassified Bradyrhizobium]|uniref:MBL fold metallo-hydrolase n=1 Tax=unclassified Bradyrhizobium TaxID=2631580 RepID=UPI0008E49AB4|nr:MULTISPECIES: MBL fold metallo-hydrolase [unclassified Bradyrhizobium]MBB4377821.1 glyoxylase-like metal-dependent hydrolase (beta-lactamase superfamily II) [Bradyrhizobium sp. SBR1B]MBB4391959.1 glyoxylase-like metal-dependent hydrolase (beta-lactamase superfamily II) [Bradyrhizobium sp. ERR14]SFN01858.1 Glyoxylase, beta-lactamase superfamily II [Bradyrhizobium sp. Rc3b]